ncbi:MAG: celH [Chloroflexi bacterium]|nr:celH [Chloroflexota bacterium]
MDSGVSFPLVGLNSKSLGGARLDDGAILPHVLRGRPALAGILVCIASLFIYLGSAGFISPGATYPSQGRQSSIALGATIHDKPVSVGSTLGAMDWYASLVGGHMPAIVNVGSDWVHNANFDARQMSDIRSRGATPMWTWLPDDYNQDGFQPRFRMRNIANGAYDPYIRRFALAAKNWGHPFLLRFAHEMNGNWYPWGTGLGNQNGTTAADYVAAWRHVHDIFTNLGASNVLWVWCANTAYTGSMSLAQVYPGDSYVDWVALDGYNYGAAKDSAGWQSLYQVFGPSYAVLTALTSKPVIITEIGSAEAGGNKASWIKQGLLNDVPMRMPRVRAVIWFDAVDDISANRSVDWRVNSSPGALAAFRAVAGSPLYQGKFSATPTSFKPMPASEAWAPTFPQSNDNPPHPRCGSCPLPSSPPARQQGRGSA